MPRRETESERKWKKKKGGKEVMGLECKRG